MRAKEEYNASVIKDSESGTETNTGTHRDPQPQGHRSD